ncbi:NADH dehydrogenase [ubiquinone] 1 alpha subcomplex subunit 1-like [Homarus americanus]|uniref:NADH dehydrogenase [ubiquinone] 1 alpha subcomplex subunit 1-like n=1 Tax=Homarus americanus TaxID=6706 RepID=A0A8J5K441_HOMAM|nr:NADH dehydrogenase [ubiquinone] 1 alpha subcomplex subunit 1-like [Homarus americanus]
MWYNIIPSFAIVTGALGLPALIIAGLHKLAYNNRDLQYQTQRFMFLRDERISGSAFKPVGLENIPDEPSE